MKKKFGPAERRLQDLSLKPRQIPEARRTGAEHLPHFMRMVSRFMGARVSTLNFL